MFPPSLPFSYHMGPVLRLEPASNTKPFMPIDIDLTASGAQLKFLSLPSNIGGEGVDTSFNVCEPAEAWCDPSRYLVRRSPILHYFNFVTQPVTRRLPHCVLT